MKKKTISMFLTLSMIASLCSGCGDKKETTDVVADATETVTESGTEIATEVSETEAEETELVLNNGTPWINSCLKENVTADMPTDPKDDFHLYVNKDWILDNSIPEGASNWSMYAECQENTDKLAVELLQKNDLSGHNAELIQTLYNLYLDWDARAEVGVTPLEETTNALLSITNIDEIKELITDSDYMGDVSPVCTYSIYSGIEDSTYKQVYVDEMMLIRQDAAEYPEASEYGAMYEEIARTYFVYLMDRLGMPEEEANAHFDNAIAFETEMADCLYTVDEMYAVDYMDKVNNNMTFEEVVGLTTNYPMEDILTAEGLKYDKNYIVSNPEFIAKLDSVFDDEHAKMIRDYMLVDYVTSEISCLDKDARDYATQVRNEYYGISGVKDDSVRAYYEVSSILPVPLAQVYVETYCSEEDRQTVEDFCYQVIDSYREILSENDWASEETIAAAIEKLDAMTVNVGWPDEWKDYSSLDLTGCTYYEALEKISEYESELVLASLGKEVDEADWTDGMSLLECNAFYDPSNNSINMILGMMGEPFYSSEMSTEQLYASLGAFWIGHEVSHAFDSSGAQFDKDGNYVNWWTEDDFTEFYNRVDKMDAYLDQFLIMGDYYVTGSNVDTEMIADMTGLQCAVNMASKVEDFDYKEFFEYFAKMNTSLDLYYSLVDQIESDSHPVNYQRTNVPVQQFEEFYEAFDVKEGDGMYLAPEDRLIIW